MAIVSVIFRQRNTIVFFNLISRYHMISDLHYFVGTYKIDETGSKKLYMYFKLIGNNLSMSMFSCFRQIRKYRLFRFDRVTRILFLTSQSQPHPSGCVNACVTAMPLF